MKLLPLLLVMILLSAGLPPASQSSEIVPLNRIVAVVNDSVITETELNAKLRIIAQQIAQRGTPPPPSDILKAQVLERLITDAIQLQLAASTGIRIDDDILNRTIARLAASNKMSIEQFRRAIEQDGFSFNQFREDIRNELTLRRLHERQIVQRVHVSGTEIEQFILDEEEQSGSNKEYHLAHILVALPETPSPEEVAAAREKAEMIIQKLEQSADFSQLAISYSDGQQALEGGDLGWRKGNQLPTLFAKTVPRLKAGEISELIRGPNGFHLIKVIDIKGGDKHIAEQTLARHILIKTNTLVDDKTAAARLAEYRRRILAGESFAQLAKEFSDDLGSASRGGELGWVSPGEMVPEFEAVMNSLQPGEISTPFKSNFGWHIIEVLERRKQDITDEIKRRQAQQVLRQRKIEQETESWLLRLRDEAYVDIRLDT